MTATNPETASWVAEPTGPGTWFLSQRDPLGTASMDLTTTDIYMMKSAAAITGRHWWPFGAVYGPMPPCPDELLQKPPR